MLSSRKPLLLAIGLLAILVTSPQAVAQYALGSGEALDPGGVYRDWGHGLDGSSQRNSGGLNFSTDQQDFSARIISNPAYFGGGRSWRSTLGYDFSRDYRTPIYTSTRSNPAIREPIARENYNAYYRQTPGWSSVVRSAGYDRYQGSAPSPSQIQADQRNLIESELRATRTLGQPTLVGMLQGGVAEPYSIRASPLRGLVLTPHGKDANRFGLTAYDQARLRDDLVRGRVVPLFDEDSEIDFASIGKVPANKVEPQPLFGTEGPVEGMLAASPHDSILRTMASRYGADAEQETSPTELQTLSEAYAQYQQDLSTGITQVDDRGDEVLASEANDEDEDEAEELSPEEEEAAKSEIASRLNTALRHGTLLGQFSTPEAKDRFNELLASGEERLKSGQYFWAEKRFARALRLEPTNPLATAGLAQSQLGAGLYLTAANTLKKMMKNNPEMIDVSYDANLMPPKETLFNAVDMLRNRISHGGPDAADYGLLLAYIGHQLDQPRTIDEGLASLKQADPDSPLLPTLKRIWGTDTEQAPDASTDSADESSK